MCPRTESGSTATAISVLLGVLWSATCLPGGVEVPQESSPGTLEVAAAEECVIGAPILVKVRYSRDAERSPSLFPRLDLFQYLFNVRGFSCLLESEDGTWFKFGGVGRQHEPGFPNPLRLALDVGDEIEGMFDLLQLVAVDHHGASWEEAQRLPTEWTLACSVYDLDESSGVSSPPVKMRFVEGTARDNEALRIVRETTFRGAWFPEVFYSSLDPRTLETATAETMSLLAAEDIVSLTLWAMESPSSCIERYETWMKAKRDFGVAGGLVQIIAQACYQETDKRGMDSQPTHEGIVRPSVDLDYLRLSRASFQARRRPS